MWPVVRVPFFEIDVPTSMLLRMSGVVVGLIVVLRCASRDGLDVQRIYQASVLLLGASYVGAKCAVVFEKWGAGALPDLFDLAFRSSAGSFYGALGAALLVGPVVARMLDLDVLLSADVLSPGIAAGMVFVRLGCLAAGCCYGTVCDHAWGVSRSFDASLHSLAPLGAPLHPVQLYEAAGCAMIFVLLVCLRSRRVFPGQMLVVFLAAYSTLRFVVEFWRGDHPSTDLWPLGASTAQVISIALAASTSVLAVAVYRVRRRERNMCERVPGHPMASAG